jgi:MYXO-CTERM domain-containing protein
LAIEAPARQLAAPAPQPEPPPEQVQPDDSAEPVPVNPADTSETGETASPDTAPADEDSAGPLLEPEGLAQSKQQINCACASTRAPLAWPALALLGLLWRRRSR